MSSEWSLPAKPRHIKHQAQPSTEWRENAFAHDVDALPGTRRAYEQPESIG